MLTSNRPPGTGFSDAHWPIHVVRPCSVTRNSYTVSGAAPISIEDRCSAIVALRGKPLNGPLEGTQSFGPEVVEEGLADRQPLHPHGIEVTGAGPGLGDQTGLAQHLEMVGHVLLRQAQHPDC
jgi:hypothetical protein